MLKNGKRIIFLNKSEVMNKMKDPPKNGNWILAIDPDTLKANIVIRDLRGYVPDVEGHEDLFPLSMVTEREDGFIEGGDWLVASTPNKKEHDGWYRNYWVQ